MVNMVVCLYLSHIFISHLSIYSPIYPSIYLSIHPLHPSIHPFTHLSIHPALSCGDAEKSLNQTEQVMNTVQTLSDDDLPNKLQFIATLHSCIGNAQLELGNTELALEHFQKDMEIAEEG